MDENTEMLNYIYQNAKMGTDTISSLLPSVDDINIRKELMAQLKTYDELSQRADGLLNDSGEKSKDSGVLKKAMANTMAKINATADNSPSHIAEMMINGSTMGIIDMTKKLKEYISVKPEIYSLGEEVLRFEEQSVEKIKTFLN